MAVKRKPEYNSMLQPHTMREPPSDKLWHYVAVLMFGVAVFSGLIVLAVYQGIF